MSRAEAWFPCYVNDLLGSMRWKMMKPAQRGAYWQLICWQMQSDDGHLPADVGELSSLADMDISGEAKILEALPVDDTGRRANPRALAEWQKRKAISGVRAQAGSKGMASRYHDVNKRDNKPVTSVTTSTSTSTEEQQHPQPEKENTPPAPLAGGVPVLPEASKLKARKQMPSAAIPATLASIAGFGAEWSAFLDHRRAKRQPATEHAKELLLATLAERPHAAVAALKEAMVRGWTGIKWSWIDNDSSRTREPKPQPTKVYRD